MLTRSYKKIFNLLIATLVIFTTGCNVVTPQQNVTIPSNISSNEIKKEEYKVSQEEKDYLEKKFSSLSATNKDTIGYIYVPDGNMKEPIVQNKADKTNSIYLDKTFEGTIEPLMGAVFMDHRNNSMFNDRLTWLFAHARGVRVPDFRMFKDVLNYKDQKFFDEHPYIVIETPERKYYYEALMIHEVHETTKLYKTDEELYLEYLRRNNTKISKEEYVANYIETDMKNYLSELSKSTTVFAKKDNLVFDSKDKYLVLSTCPDFIADPETRYNLYLRQITDSELTEVLKQNK